MIKILITSVGSLVGQNILDVLESRRQNITIIGLNSVAANARNFRCDKVYLVPPTTETINFEKAFEEIFTKEMPDLVLAGRDIDVVFLADFLEKNPEYSNRLPFGSKGLAYMMFDKYESYQFAMANGFPFAETCLYKNQYDADILKNFVSNHGFPMVCKPRQGNGSIDVFFVLDQYHLQKIIDSFPEFILQEYLCPDPQFHNYVRKYNTGIPLFFQIPENHHYVAQAVIGKGGEISGIIKTRHEMVGGKAEYTEIYSNHEIDEMVFDAVNAIAQSGWVGFLNLQYKPDKYGKWKIFEMNPRMVGASASRYLLGFDELGLLVKSFFTEWDFPAAPEKQDKDGIVVKYLTDYYISKNDITKLSERGSWEISGK